MLLVARQLAVNTMRLGCVLAQALDTVGLIGLEVALEPIPVARILVGALPRQNVRGDAVQEHTVVANDHRAARELEQRRFERGQRLDVEVVRGLVEEQQVAALLERERQVQTVAFAAGQHAHQLLLVGTLEAEGRHVGAGRHFHAGHLDEVESVGHGLPQVLVRVKAGTVLVDVADLHGVADLERTGGQRLQADDGLEQGGLACAVGTDQGNDLAVRHVQRHTCLLYTSDAADE